MKTLIESINGIKSENAFQNSIGLLNIVDQFELPSEYFNDLIRILDDKNLSNGLKKFNHIAVDRYFQPRTKKRKTELIEEFASLNPKENIDLTKRMNEVDQFGSRINNWEQKDIKEWSKRKGFHDIEAIVVIKRAIYLEMEIDVNETQIMSCLVALDQSPRKGKLLQVATGEGKSIIVCILAIINALRDTYVNVITSSSVLAERDAKSNQKLYGMFGLTCNDNADKTVYIKGQKECYKSNIVYGDVSQFQFDKLRDEYSQLGTVSERNCKIAIIDEVDVMLIELMIVQRLLNWPQQSLE